MGARETVMQALLVDDHTLFREGMKALLRLLRPETEVLQAGSVREAIDVLAKCHRVDLVLLDLQLPGMRGLDALDAVRAFNDEIPIVVLSGNEDSGTVCAAIEHAWERLICWR